MRIYLFVTHITENNTVLYSRNVKSEDGLYGRWSNTCYACAYPTICLNDRNKCEISISNCKRYCLKKKKKSMASEWSDIKYKFLIIKKYFLILTRFIYSSFCRCTGLGIKNWFSLPGGVFVPLVRPDGPISSIVEVFSCQKWSTFLLISVAKFMLDTDLRSWSFLSWTFMYVFYCVPSLRKI